MNINSLFAYNIGHQKYIFVQYCYIVKNSKNLRICNVNFQINLLEILLFNKLNKLLVFIVISKLVLLELISYNSLRRFLNHLILIFNIEKS